MAVDVKQKAKPRRSRSYSTTSASRVRAKNCSDDGGRTTSSVLRSRPISYVTIGVAKYRVNTVKAVSGRCPWYGIFVSRTYLEPPSRASRRHARDWFRRRRHRRRWTEWRRRHCRASTSGRRGTLMNILMGNFGKVRACATIIGVDVPSNRMAELDDY